MRKAQVRAYLSYPRVGELMINGPILVAGTKIINPAPNKMLLESGYSGHKKLSTLSVFLPFFAS